MLVLACDFDGTIAPIVGQPDQAAPLPGAMRALGALAALPHTAVALVSGRARGDLLRLAGQVPGVLYIGSHGAEWGSDYGEAVPNEDAELLRRLVRQVKAIARDVPGVLIEQKPASVAVHVRRAGRDDAAKVLASVAQGPAAVPGVAVIEGKEVIELSVAHGTKGTAVQRLRQMFAPDVLCYLGDDTTDEDAFAELGPQDIGFKVGPGPSRAGRRLAGPAETVALLVSLAQRRSAAVALSEG
jgi:trehalose-phosphatase